MFTFLAFILDCVYLYISRYPAVTSIFSDVTSIFSFSDVMPLSAALCRYYDVLTEGILIAAYLMKYGSRLDGPIQIERGNSILEVIVRMWDISSSRNQYAAAHDMCTTFYRCLLVVICTLHFMKL